MITPTSLHFSTNRPSQTTHTSVNQGIGSDAGSLQKQKALEGFSSLITSPFSLVNQGIAVERSLQQRFYSFINAFLPSSLSEDEKVSIKLDLEIYLMKCQNNEQAPSLVEKLTSLGFILPLDVQEKLEEVEKIAKEKKLTTGQSEPSVQDVIEVDVPLPSTTTLKKHNSEPTFLQTLNFYHRYYSLKFTK